MGESAAHLYVLHVGCLLLPVFVVPLGLDEDEIACNSTSGGAVSQTTGQPDDDSARIIRS